MKCKLCGYNARSIAAMAAHYRKEHPRKMKRGAKGRGYTKAARLDNRSFFEELKRRLGG